MDFRIGWNIPALVGGPPSAYQQTPQDHGFSAAGGVSGTESGIWTLLYHDALRLRIRGAGGGADRRGKTLRTLVGGGALPSASDRRRFFDFTGNGLGVSRRLGRLLASGIPRGIEMAGLHRAGSLRVLDR